MLNYLNYNSTTGNHRKTVQHFGPSWWIMKVLHLGNSTVTIDYCSQGDLAPIFSVLPASVAYSLKRILRKMTDILLSQEHITLFQQVISNYRHTITTFFFSLLTCHDFSVLRSAAQSIAAAYKFINVTFWDYNYANVTLTCVCFLQHVGKGKQRCGQCEGCTMDSCGKCVYCLDMTKYGGPGKKEGLSKKNMHKVWCYCYVYPNNQL